jgi:hypothetical protein
MKHKKPLYFLTHEGRPELFSGYGIPIMDEMSPLMGMLIVDLPEDRLENHLKKIYRLFGEFMVGPARAKGGMGIFSEMWIEDPYSQKLLRENISIPVAQDIEGF